MFTKKPERDSSEDAFQRLSERPSVELTPPERSIPRSTGGKVVPSVIGEDLTIVGNVTSKGEIQLEGHVQGDIHCGSILLGEKSQVTGGVIADDVVVRGRVMGSIRGVRVTLQAPAHVEGDVFHQSLAIEQGAFFEGKSRRSDNPLATPKQADEKPQGVVVAPSPNRAAE
jgi:cytoskeletal protein CcmA (bactofilin family)